MILLRLDKTRGVLHNGMESFIYDTVSGMVKVVGRGVQFGGIIVREVNSYLVSNMVEYVRYDSKGCEELREVFSVDELNKRLQQARQRGSIILCKVGQGYKQYMEVVV